MNRVVRPALAAALVAALGFGVAAARSANYAHLSYARVFDSTQASFLPTLPESLASTNLVSDSVFGIDVQLPIFMQTSQKALYDGSAPAALVQRQESLREREAAITPWITGITFRLHGAKIQMQYQRYAPASGGDLSVASRYQPSSAPQTNGTLSAVSNGAFNTGAAFAVAAPPPPFETSASADLAPLAPPPVAARLTLPVRIGPVHFASNVEGSARPQDSFGTMSRCGTADANAACAALAERDNRFAAGTTFDVRAGSHHVDLHLSGSLEHQSLPDDTSLPFIPMDPQSPQSSSQAAPLAGHSAISYPNFVDVTKHGLNANLAVPVNSRVTVNLGYDTQHLQGGYNAVTAPGTGTVPSASTLAPAIDAYKNTYLGNVTYKFPHTGSAITLSARQYRYQDAALPNLNLTQTRADVNFTVKF